MQKQRSREVFFDEKNTVNIGAITRRRLALPQRLYEFIHAPMVTVTEIIVSITNMTNK